MGTERGLAREDCSQGLPKLGLSPSSGGPLGPGTILVLTLHGQERGLELPGP